MKILIVDDFDTMHKIIRNCLTEAGYEDVIQAYDGHGALFHLNKHKVDLIISDWNMPKMTGIELLKAVRANPKLADIPFIMLTAEAEKNNIAEAIKADVDQYLIKPFSAEILAKKIKFALQKRNK